VTKRDIYINYICNKLRDTVDNLQESLYDKDKSAPIQNANEIISISYTIMNQLEEQ
jgi:hypothetical protein